MASKVFASAQKDYEHDSRLSFTNCAGQSPGRPPRGCASPGIVVLSREGYSLSRVGTAALSS
jgi:hypothetical protein